MSATDTPYPPAGVSATDTRPAPPAGLPRILPPGASALSFAAHQARYGPLLPLPADFVSVVDRSGLCGRGGAAFPTARKLAAVANQLRRAVVVANGAESEPVSGKDRTLLTLAPHLVLDGVAVAAQAVGAGDAVVCIDRSAGAAHRALVGAIAQRADEVAVRVALVPTRYVAGEETALVNLLNGHDAKPQWVPPRPFERGVQGRPTLVDNVETLAHLALIARYGAEWFQAVGTAGHPGSMLVTITGAVARPGVLEAACGTTVRELVTVAGGPREPLSALLLGGYFGTWTPAESALARPVDLTVGAGAIVAFPASACGLVEVARLARWLAGQSAGQCGPCVHGLPAIAKGVEAVAEGRVGEVEADLRRWLAIVPGRGACHLPDGVSRLIASGLDTFAPEIQAHRAGYCMAANQARILPLPAS